MVMMNLGSCSRVNSVRHLSPKHSRILTILSRHASDRALSTIYSNSYLHRLDNSRLMGQAYGMRCGQRSEGAWRRTVVVEDKIANVMIHMTNEVKYLRNGIVATLSSDNLFLYRVHTRRYHQLTQMIVSNNVNLFSDLTKATYPRQWAIITQQLFVRSLMRLETCLQRSQSRQYISQRLRSGMSNSRTIVHTV